MSCVPVDRSTHHIERAPIGIQPATRSWYFTKDEIDNHSPSRKDGIDRVSESLMRKQYCSFLKELGIKLRVGPVTTATAMMFCHRFYMRQSLAKNDWQTIATACMFLACKVEENLHPLRDVVVVAYELIYKWDPSASEKIRQREVHYKQQKLILDAEHLLLVTIAFDMNIQHPFKPLVDALKRLKISNNDVAKAAWNLLNEWLRTTLCLQYKPHCIAAGSLSVAAKLLNFKLPVVEGIAWWMHFDVSPKQLQEVTQQMLRYLKHDGKQKVSQARTNEKKMTHKVEIKTSQMTQSCAQSGVTMGSDMTNEGAPMYTLNHTTEAFRNMSKQASSDCCSEICSLMDNESTHTSSVTAHVDDGSEIDVGRLRGAFEKARRVRYGKNKVVAVDLNEGNGELDIERELEEGVEHGYLAAVKKQKVAQD
ncbi:hypothetical protein vseg_009188 [Gypsophila vaccaria]